MNREKENKKWDLALFKWAKTILHKFYYEIVRSKLRQSPLKHMAHRPIIRRILDYVNPVALFIFKMSNVIFNLIVIVGLNFVA